MGRPRFLLPVILLGSVCVCPKLPAQYHPPRNGVHLTPYLQVSRWGGQANLVGPGANLETFIIRHLTLYLDVGINGRIGGCETLTGPTCPGTVEYFFAGARLFPAQTQWRLQPYLAASAGRVELQNTTSLLRAEIGLDAGFGRRLVLRFGVQYGSTVRGRIDERIWGVLLGTSIRL
jgi:hypothetical protein